MTKIPKRQKSGTLSKINFAENPKIAINPVPLNGGYGVSVAYRLD